MQPAPNWADVVLTALLGFLSLSVAGGAAGLFWGLTQKRRELDLAATQSFYDTYGRWFSTWKQWAAVRQGALDEDERSALLKQAAEIEGQFEAQLVKICLERRLSTRRTERLGRFREGYQQLREAIESQQDVPFKVQDDPDSEGAYLVFKSLSVEFASLARGRWSARRPTLEQGKLALVRVTSWRNLSGAKARWWCDAAGTSAAAAARRWAELRYR